MPMTSETKRAAPVPMVIAQRTSSARRRRTSSSAGLSPPGSTRISRTRVRSTMRASRLTKTLRREATPVRRKAGASATWMTRAMSWTWDSSIGSI